MNRKIQFTACIVALLLTVTGCPDDCDCKSPDKNCNCGDKHCNCHENWVKEQKNAFAKSTWSGLDNNGQEVKLVVLRPEMTLTYKVKTIAKRTVNWENVEVKATAYQFDAETGTFSAYNDNVVVISGTKSSDTTISVFLPTNETVGLTKK